MREREADYEKARQWMRELARGPLAVVTQRTPAGRVFLDVMIEGQRFQGIQRGETLYVSGAGGQCALGVASINLASSYGEPEDWHICKYWHEAKCPLPLSEAGRRALAVTFGLPIWPEARQVTPCDVFEMEHFYDSPAFVALHAWAKKVPRRVAGLVGDSYLYLWPLSALEGGRVPVTTENVARARAAASGGGASRRASPRRDAAPPPQG